jgi:hypothetical protein
MKRTLLASVACLGLAVAIPARADMPTIDIASITARAAQAGNALREMQQQYQMMQQQYGQLVSTYNVLSHPNQVLDIAKGMAQQQLRSPGSSGSSIPGLSYGSSLSSAAGNFMSRNRYSEPQGDDFSAQEMRRREQSTANIQAEAQEGLNRSDERINYLNQLQGSIQDQPDVTAVAAVEARIQSEHLYLQNEGNNVARLALMERTMARVDQQRAEQAGRREAEDWYAHAAAQAWGSE